MHTYIQWDSRGLYALQGPKAAQVAHEHIYKHTHTHIHTYIHTYIQWDNRGLYALQGPEAAQVLQRLVPSVNLSKMSFGDAATMKVDYHCEIFDVYM